MRISVQEIAAEVIRSANRDKPADAALREVLRECRELAPFDATEVSRLVFLYYRWHGWIRDERGVDAKMRLARSLAERFQANPASIPMAELRAKAVPDWTAAEMDVSEDWLRSLQREPKLWLRAKRGQGGGLAAKLGAARTLDFPDAVVYEGDTDLFKTPEFHAGEFEIQDIASQAVGLLCDPQPGETWWDACAGEGGKTLHLSDLMANKGLIWVSDRAAWRLQKLKRRTARAKVFNYRAALWDGGAKLPTKTKFDGVLLDAPCSGLGTWHRNPHARWTVTLGDVRELAEVQQRLLAHVAPAVKPGGRLIFSVCTLTRRETTAVADAFSESEPAFERLPLGGPENRSRALASAAHLLKDKMFVAVWRRKN
ncbi:MAG: RsmB/NOP family class I SAM-dependent RNA methyltransferase [Pedosphaera sp.]|nr:RsmB/NOP family class I SAM-dependent RNA methyltransferase [Pedosphaera sp.]